MYTPTHTSDGKVTGHSGAKIGNSHLKWVFSEAVLMMFRHCEDAERFLARKEKTLGNWYTTILNAYGNPTKHFGDLDMALESRKLPQVGPITEFTA